MSKRPRGLGSGFASLLGEKAVLTSDAVKGDQLLDLPISDLVSGRFQPRTQWNDDRLTELSLSIRTQGVVQPIVVRAIDHGRYEIIAGERRWRAAKLAGLTVIPAVVRSLSDQSALAVALIENIQREGLTAIEEARAIRNLTDTFSLTHEQAAELLGRSRESVSNLLRLLKLDESVQEMVLDGQLSAGHARSLVSLTVEKQRLFAQQAISLQWSVRELETAVRRLQQSEVLAPAKKPVLSSQAQTWQTQLMQTLGTEVKLTMGASGRGKIEIPFDHEQSLSLLIEKLMQLNVNT